MKEQITFYPNQLTAAGEIKRAFEEGHKVIVVKAQEQSGKTGTALCAIDLIKKESKTLGKTLATYITSLSNISVKDQTNNQINMLLNMREEIHDSYGYIFNSHRDTLKGATGKTFADSIKEEFNTGKYNTLLFILDECHEGISPEGLLDKFFLYNFGCNLEDYITDKWPIHIKVLCMSATPYVYDKIFTKAHFITMQPGDTYGGVENLFKSGRLIDTDGKKASDDNFALLDKFLLAVANFYSNKNGIVYIRCEADRKGNSEKNNLLLQNRITEFFASSFKHIKVSSNVYDDNSHNIKQLFELQKKSSIAIMRDLKVNIHFALIKQSMRAGNTVDTGNCLGWFETGGVKNQVDIITQRTGRNYGYDAEHSGSFKRDELFPIASDRKRLQAQFDWYKGIGDTPLGINVTEVSISKAKGTNHWKLFDTLESANIHCAELIKKEIPTEQHSSYFQEAQLEKGNYIPFKDNIATNTSLIPKILHEQKLHYRVFEFPSIANVPQILAQKKRDPKLLLEVEAFYKNPTFKDFEGKYAVVEKREITPGIKTQKINKVVFDKQIQT